MFEDSIILNLNENGCYFGSLNNLIITWDPIQLLACTFLRY